MDSSSTGLGAIAIPYRTCPRLDVGGLHLHTFGVFVGLGGYAGSRVAAWAAEGTQLGRRRMRWMLGGILAAGLVGSRLSWLLTQIEPRHQRAVALRLQQGGLHLYGGLLGGALAAVPALMTLRTADDRWEVVDAGLLGVASGLAVGRIGCLAVGEHFGGPSDSLLAVHYRGGQTVEPAPPVGSRVHQTSLYEALHLGLLVALLSTVRRRGGALGRPGVISGLAMLWYGVGRLLTDRLRIHDRRRARLTAAQWISAGLAPAGLMVLVRRIRS